MQSKDKFAIVLHKNQPLQLHWFDTILLKEHRRIKAIQEEEQMPIFYLLSQRRQTRPLPFAEQSLQCYKKVILLLHQQRSAEQMPK